MIDRNIWRIGLLCVAVCLGITISAHADLVGHWNFDDNTSDQSGNGHDGTNLLNVTYDTDVPAALGSGKSLSFVGDTRVDIPADTALNSNVFTQAFWINQPGQTGSSDGLYERITSRDSDSYELALGTDNSLRYYPGGGWTDTGHDLPVGQWQHVAMVSSGNTMRTYINGALVSSGSFTGNPTGIMRIGARASQWTEGVVAKMDDFMLFDTRLPDLAIEALASGQDIPDITTVLSNPTDWMLSTVRTSGGPNGTWTPGTDPLPDVSTYTLPTVESTLSGVISAASDLGVISILGDGGNNATPGAGVQYYRTTFDLDPFTSVEGKLILAADNGAQIFINGDELARETSFLVENWSLPYSSLSIDPDGLISDVTLFDSTASSFTNWLVGENELVVVLRNPDSDIIGGGAFALRMELIASGDVAVPEPSSLALLAIGGLGAILFARRKRRADLK